MLWLNHPKPAGERTPVESLLMRERMRHQDGAPAPRTAGAASPLAGTRTAYGSAALDEVPGTVAFSVRYSLPEYTSFMWQHCSYLIRRRRIGTLPSWWLCTKSTATAALHFVLQGRARRTYEFTIDTHGIVRASGTGVTLVAWRDVSAIRRYSRGYMLVMARGTLPLPFRCLDRAQQAAIDGFAVLVKAAARK